MATATATLSERAMLAKLSVSTWTGRTKDNRITSEVQEKTGAEKDSGAWWTFSSKRTGISNIVDFN